MTALHCLRAAANPDPHALSTLVEQRHGPELAREIREMEDRVPLSQSIAVPRQRLEEANALLLGAAVSGADLIATHSRLAARLARLDTRNDRVPVSVVPFAVPSPPDRPRSPQKDLISSFGMVEPEKHPTVLVEALAVLRARRPDARLRLVGPLGGGMEDLLRRRVAQLGVGDAVAWTGRLGQTEYLRELCTAAVAVQLKRTVNGESSAAIADCLAVGLPTVVSDIGAQRELPPEAVLQVPDAVGSHALAAAIERIIQDPDTAGALSRGALGYARFCSPEVAAAALTALLQAAPSPRGVG
jgi:glycosyltransferase involved in cell wall biosynthesis